MSSVEPHALNTNAHREADAFAFANGTRAEADALVEAAAAPSELVVHLQLHVASAHFVEAHVAVRVVARLAELHAHRELTGSLTANDEESRGEETKSTARRGGGCRRGDGKWTGDRVGETGFAGKLVHTEASVTLGRVLRRSESLILNSY